MGTKPITPMNTNTIEKYVDDFCKNFEAESDPIVRYQFTVQSRAIDDYTDWLRTTLHAVANEAYKKGYIDGGIAEIEANATADITIAQDKAEQIREEAVRIELEELREWAITYRSLSSGEEASAFTKVVERINMLIKNTK